MLKKITLTFAVALVALLAYASTRPDSFRIERSIIVRATPDTLFALIQDFRQWQAWSPWEKMDPAMKRTYSGPASGPGASYAWEGNDKVGAGSMAITATTPPNQVRIQLDFILPFEGHNIAEFTLTPHADATTVTWVMTGPSPFIAKLMGIFFSMDAMIGKDFEAGLAIMKAVAER